MQFFGVGNCGVCNNQQWGYLHHFRIYEGTNTPAQLPQALGPPNLLASVTVIGGEIIFGGEREPHCLSLHFCCHSTKD